MSEGGSDDAGGPGGGNGEHPGPEGADATVLAVFADPAPRTADEVADALGEGRETVRRQLDAMVAAGRLGRKAVGPDDRRVTVWYPTPGGNGTADHPDGDGADGDWNVDRITVRGEDDEGGLDTGGIDARADRRIEDLEVPGASEMMREWRRSAVRAAYDYLRRTGSARSTDVVEATYPGHRAGYSDREEWWTCVAPRLADLPGVERDGDRWEFVGVE